MRNAGCSTSSFANNDDERWIWKKSWNERRQWVLQTVYVFEQFATFFFLRFASEFEVLASSSTLAVGSATETENSATFFTITTRSRRMLECVSRWKIPFFRFSTMHFNITTPCLTVSPFSKFISIWRARWNIAIWLEKSFVCLLVKVTMKTGKPSLKTHRKEICVSMMKIYFFPSRFRWNPITCRYIFHISSTSTVVNGDGERRWRWQRRGRLSV